MKKYNKKTGFFIFVLGFFVVFYLLNLSNRTTQIDTQTFSRSLLTNPEIATWAQQYSTVLWIVAVLGIIFGYYMTFSEIEIDTQTGKKRRILW